MHFPPPRYIIKKEKYYSFINWFIVAPGGTASKFQSGRATSYKLAQITSKFPDQFKPFSVFDFTKSKNNTIFRIPLTHIGNFVNGIPSHLSETGNPVEAIRNELKAGVETSLVFLPDLEEVTWSNLQPDTKAATLEFGCSLYAKDNAA